MAPVHQYNPTPRELDDLELLLSGAYAPLTGFNEPGSVVTLSLPSELATRGSEVELVDPEGLPLAVVSVREGGWPVRGLSPAEHGPFRRLHLSPTEVRQQYAGRTVVPVSGPLSTRELAGLRGIGSPLLLLALTGTGTPDLSPVALIRATLAASGHLPDAEVVAVALPAHDNPEADHALGVQVAQNYADEDPVHALVGADGPFPDDIRDIVDVDQPEPGEQGLVLFFTGLSGSGKSTLARALLDRILEQGERSVTSLDGDVVRRNLSAGLTFSKEDRETNIRRIGWVAAEIARHRGIALCSPIAPFDETRQQVRAMVEDAGGDFFLVHVATPVEECERRDRKGLYAKARRGEIPEFTGISSPYEEPEDADVRVDTTGRTIEECLDEVIAALAETAHLDLTEGASSSEGPLSVLFVCTANICRSPFLELRTRELVGDALSVSSAGTHGFSAHEMSTEMRPYLSGEGVADFRSRPVTRELVDQADVVITAEESHREAIIAEQPGAFRKVFNLGQFAASVQAAPDDLTGRALLDAVMTHRVPTQKSFDVADPYRRGEEASRRAADQMNAALDVVVRRLARR